jgi:type IV secretory pathway VirB2 component (pilin)
MGGFLATVIAGLPYTALVVVAIIVVVLYGWLFAWSADNNHDRLAWLLIVIVILFLCTGMSYFFGSF